MTARQNICLAATVLASLGAGCHLIGDANIAGDGGRGGDEAPVDGGGLTDGAPLLDGETSGEGGPMVVILDTIEILDDARLCDLDGDGVMDNVIADLGNPHAGLMAMAMNTALAGGFEHGVDGHRIVLHFPWIEDLDRAHGPRPRMFIYQARDTDYPRDPSDDLSGEEPVYAGAGFLDGCGEPLYETVGVSLENGALAFSGGEFVLRVASGPLTVASFSGEGEVAPRGASLEAQTCGYWSLRELATHRGFDEAGDSGLSFLEQFLVGGASVGLPSFPGLSPDVDIDGDGLERFEQDEAGQIVACIDGDNTTIAGRDCWQDEGFVDGFSLNFLLRGVSARFAGPAPGWEYEVEGTCEGGPPEESLFGTFGDDGPCVAVDEPCDPLLAQPCCNVGHRCSGVRAERYLCMAPCTASPCNYGGTLGECVGAAGPTAGVCVPLVSTLDPVACIVGEPGCTTDYGERDGTMCFDYPAGTGPTYCAESCERLPSGCPDTHDCMPLDFRGEGWCALRPESVPP